MSKRKATLKAIVFDLQYRAHKQPGIAQSARLSGGLFVEILIEDGETKLQISRPDVAPAWREIDLILDRWPYDLPQIERRYVKHRGRHYIIAIWDTTVATLSNVSPETQVPRLPGF